MIDMKTAPTFDIRHGERVRVLVTQRYDDGSVMLAAGKVGTVKAMIAKGGRPEYLVKWDRRAWPVAVWRDEIERVS